MRGHSVRRAKRGRVVFIEGVVHREIAFSGITVCEIWFEDSVDKALMANDRFGTIVGDRVPISCLACIAEEESDA